MIPDLNETAEGPAFDGIWSLVYWRADNLPDVPPWELADAFTKLFIERSRVALDDSVSLN